MDNLLSQFNYADYLSAGLILVWTLFGVKKGMSGQIAIFLAGLSVLCALHFGFIPCRNWMVERFRIAPELARVFAVVALATTPLLVVLVIHSVAGYVVKVTFTAWVDRLCGGVAAFCTACAFVALVFVALNVMPERVRPRAVGEPSWIGRRVHGAQTALSRFIGSRMDNTRNVIEQAREIRTTEREKWEQ